MSPITAIHHTGYPAFSANKPHGSCRTPIEPFSRFSPEYRHARDTALKISGLTTLVLSLILALTQPLRNPPQTPSLPNQAAHTTVQPATK